MNNPREPALSDLPATIPIFPLTGALLLPRGRLPLNIFEPRYLAMIDDALSSRDRLIGMIQPREPGSEGMMREGHIPSPMPVYPTGCAGRIVKFVETRDRRYIITLRGICRFTLAEELPTPRGYRRAKPDFAAWETDLARPQADDDEGIDRDRLLKSLRAYFSVQNLTADWSAVTETPTARLITMLAMMCPFAPQEKQALLECRTFEDRVQTVLMLMEMGAASAGGEQAKPN